MKVSTHRALKIAFSCLLAFGLARSAASGLDARAVIERVYRQDTSRDAISRTSMEVVEPGGKIRKKKFMFYKLGSLGSSKTLLRFTDPAEVRGMALLSINAAGATGRQWVYTPATGRVRRVAPQERSRPFLGTDFTHGDMAERSLDDYTYRTLVESEILDGTRTAKIEVRPIRRDSSGYKYTYLWIAQEIPVVVYAEMYDKHDQKRRTLHASQLEKIRGIWVARRIEMRSCLERTRTVLRVEDIRFDSGLGEQMFTSDALEKSGTP